MPRRTKVAALVTSLLLTTVVGCSGSKFGDSTKQNANYGANADATPAGNGNGTGNDGGTGNSSVDDAQAGGPGGSGNAGGAGGAGGPGGLGGLNDARDANGNITNQGDASGGLIGTAQGNCLKKSSLYNIVMVFDVSGSQAQTDPTKLRVTGAKDFLNKLSAFADVTPTSKFNVSITGFARTATFGANGWKALNKTTLGDLSSDINTITAPLSAGTFYLSGLHAADKLLLQQNATDSNKAARNFVIFMTDGEPNGRDTIAQINGAAADLANNRGAAMIMLGTGTGVSAKGEGILQNMALPKTGIVNAQHTGKYFRVATEAQMAKIGDILTGAVAGCE